MLLVKRQAALNDGDSDAALRALQRAYVRAHTRFCRSSVLVKLVRLL
jgi:hypothetical protein